MVVHPTTSTTTTTTATSAPRVTPTVTTQTPPLGGNLDGAAAAVATDSNACHVDLNHDNNDAACNLNYDAKAVCDLNHDDYDDDDACDLNHDAACDLNRDTDAADAACDLNHDAAAHSRVCRVQPQSRQRQRQRPLQCVPRAISITTTPLPTLVCAACDLNHDDDAVAYDTTATTTTGALCQHKMMEPAQCDSYHNEEAMSDNNGHGEIGDVTTATKR
jgi:hypothetical protein